MFSYYVQLLYLALQQITNIAESYNVQSILRQFSLRLHDLIPTYAIG